MDMNSSEHTHGNLFFRLKTKSILFIPQWTTSGVYGLTGAMLTAIILSVTYECLAEYLLYLQNRVHARKTRPGCGGSPTVSCWEKLAQTVVHLFRVLLGYLLMLCVMTTNIWLLAAVLVGAVVGYGVGKPLVANCIMDMVSSHEYRVTGVQMSYSKHNPSQRSTSWRYTKDMLDTDSVKLREEIEHLTGGVDMSNHDDVFGDGDRTNAATEVIWIRRSDLELDKSAEDEYTNHNDVQMRQNTRKDKTIPKELNETTDSIKSDDSLLSRNSSRFKSTSKVINASFRTNNSESYRQGLSRQSGFDSIERAHARQNVSRTSSMNTPSVPIRGATVNRSVSSASHIHGPKSSPQLASRYKSISRQISRDLKSNSVDRV